MMDLNTGQSTQVAAHDAPIKSARFVDGLTGAPGTMVVTGSWDKTLKVCLCPSKKKNILYSIGISNSYIFQFNLIQFSIGIYERRLLQ
jgi:hypothetical protein